MPKEKPKKKNKALVERNKKVMQIMRDDTPFKNAAIDKTINAGGRPTLYSIELAQKICRSIASSTDSMTKICNRNPEFPNRECIWSWRLDYPEFSNMYNDAKRQQADLLAEEILEIADDARNDIIHREDRDGNEYEVINSEFVARSKIRIETRKWHASKMLPKVYGDRLELEKKEEENAVLIAEIRILRAKLDEQNKKDY
jgi:hypothetical protein